VYDITSRASFDRVAHWVAEITDHCAGAEEAVLMLVGNKLDRADERAVSFAEGAAMARAHDMLYIETSARSYAGVRQVWPRNTLQIRVWTILSVCDTMLHRL